MIYYRKTDDKMAVMAAHATYQEQQDGLDVLRRKDKDRMVVRAANQELQDDLDVLRRKTEDNKEAKQ